MKALYQYPDRVGGAAADEVPAGSFCGGDEIPPGTFHGGDEIPPGTFHGGDEIPPGTFHNVEAPRKIIEEVEKVR